MGSVSLSVNYINKATFFLLNGGVFLIGFGVRVGSCPDCVSPIGIKNLLT